MARLSEENVILRRNWLSQDSIKCSTNMRLQFIAENSQSDDPNQMADEDLDEVSSIPTWAPCSNTYRIMTGPEGILLDGMGTSQKNTEYPMWPAIKLLKKTWPHLKLCKKVMLGKVCLVIYEEGSVCERSCE